MACTGLRNAGLTHEPMWRAQVFCKNLNNLQSTFFDRLMPEAPVAGGAVYTMPQDIVTNHLVIRGSFQVWCFLCDLMST